jgi:hypothetical protein
VPLILYFPHNSSSCSSLKIKRTLGKKTRYCSIWQPNCQLED